MYNKAQPDCAKYNVLEAETFRSAQPMRQVVNCAVENGTMMGDPLSICYVLWAGLHGLISLNLAHLIDNKRSFEELAAAMIHSLIRAVGCETSNKDRLEH